MGISTRQVDYLNLVRFVMWFSILWIVITICAVISALPFALRIIEEGKAETPGEMFVVTWPLIMVSLSIPAGITLMIILFDRWGDTRIARMLYGESASQELSREDAHDLIREARRIAKEAGLVEPHEGVLEHLHLKHKHEKPIEETESDTIDHTVSVES
jgi:hypothetical protein